MVERRKEESGEEGRERGEEKYLEVAFQCIVSP